MSKLPETLGACEQLLVMVELDLKPRVRQRDALRHRIAVLRGAAGPPGPAAGAASVQGEQSPRRGRSKA